MVRKVQICHILLIQQQSQLIAFQIKLQRIIEIIVKLIIFAVPF